MNAKLILLIIVFCGSCAPSFNPTFGYPKPSVFELTVYKLSSKIEIDIIAARFLRFLIESSKTATALNIQLFIGIRGMIVRFFVACSISLLYN